MKKIVMSENNKIGEQEVAVKCLVANDYLDQTLRIMLGLEDRE